MPPDQLYGDRLRLRAEAVRRMIARYGELAGIPRERCHPHAFRHLFGISPSEVRKSGLVAAR